MRKLFLQTKQKNKPKVIVLAIPTIDKLFIIFKYMKSTPPIHKEEKMEMQKAKSRTLPILIITILALSICATISVQAVTIAPTIKTIEIYDTVNKEWRQVTPYQGNVGDQVRVTVDGVTPGGLVQLYWDSTLMGAKNATGTEAKITFTVPASIAGTHYIKAKDVETNLITYVEFKVLPKITLSPSEVLPGDTVTVSGSGFAGSVSVTVLYNPSSPKYVENEKIGDADGSTKNFALSHKPVSPEKGVVIYVGGAPSTIDYTVNYVTGIVTFDKAPEAGDINASYYYYDATVTASTATNSVGSFIKSFKVPSTEAVDHYYKVLAVDAAGNYAYATLKVVAQKITLSPEKGFKGSTVTVTGRGFTAGETVDIRWYFAETATGTYITLVEGVEVGSDGTFSTSFKVPSVEDPTPPGTEYAVQAYSSDDKHAEATFTVIAPAKITLNPTSGKAGTTVQISGTWFTAGAEISFTFGGQALEVSPSPVYADENGAFTTYFDVPDVDAGTYVVQATDTEGVSATAKFKVIVPTIIIKTRATQYMPGDTISFYVNSSKDILGAYLEITDPNGMVFWSCVLGDSNITKIDSWYVLKSYLTASLPSDAPLGTWNFTAYDSKAKEEILATNLFTIVAKPSLQAVIDSIDKNTATVNSKLDSLAKQVSSLSDSVGSMSATVSSIKDTLTSSVTSIRNDISSVKGDIAALSSSMSTGFSNVNSALGTLTSSVNNLGGLSGQITSLGNTLSKSISDNANSIQTSIKNAQDAVSSQVKSSVGDLSTFLIIIGILAAITLVIEAAILIRRLS